MSRTDAEKQANEVIIPPIPAVGGGRRNFAQDPLPPPAPATPQPTGPGTTPTPNTDIQPATPGGTPPELGNASKYNLEGRNLLLEAAKNFGVTLSEQELESLEPLYNPDIGVGADILRSVFANYVSSRQSVQNLNANDPTNQLMSDEKGFFNDVQRQAGTAGQNIQNLTGQLQSTMTSAPNLFGSLTPEQIDQYLAPLKNTFDQSRGQVAGDAARRGLAGSSTELNSLNEQDRMFRENVLATGLNVGLQEQSQNEGILQGLIGNNTSLLENYYGLQPGSLARQQNLATASYNRSAGQGQYMANLPMYELGVSQSIPKLTNPGSTGGGGNSLAGLFPLLTGGVGATIGGMSGGGIPGAALGYSIGSGAGNSLEGLFS